jgi:hypothetical protein
VSVGERAGYDWGMTSPETDATAAFRCSDAARDRDDPFVATAPPARCWLLVEHPGPWGHQALGDAGYPPEVVDAIDAFCRTRGARFQLIRRSRSRGEPAADIGRFALVDTTPGAESVRWGRVSSPAELPAALADVEAVTTPSPDPVYLVCAHGRHDACCAMRGRPVAAELTAAYPDRTWETTHTGGDRFAANVVLLPHGLVLGRVPATEAVAVAERYGAGEVDTTWVRGRSFLTPPAQAAQHHARLALHESHVDALRVLGVEVREPGTVEVTLDGGPERGPVTVVVRERWVASPTPLTCSAGRAASMRVYDLVELTPAAAVSGLGVVLGGAAS